MQRSALRRPSRTLTHRLGPDEPVLKSGYLLTKQPCECTLTAVGPLKVLVLHRAREQLAALRARGPINDSSPSEEAVGRDAPVAPNSDSDSDSDDVDDDSDDSDDDKPMGPWLGLGLGLGLRLGLGLGLGLGLVHEDSDDSDDNKPLGPAAGAASDPAPMGPEERCGASAQRTEQTQLRQRRVISRRPA